MLLYSASCQHKGSNFAFQTFNFLALLTFKLFSKKSLEVGYCNDTLKQRVALQKLQFPEGIPAVCAKRLSSMQQLEMESGVGCISQSPWWVWREVSSSSVEMMWGCGKDAGSGFGSLVALLNTARAKHCPGYSPHLYFCILVPPPAKRKDGFPCKCFKIC